jgi:hypothetical protein
MIKLDSVKLKAPLECVKHLSKSGFLHQNSTKDGNLVSDKHLLSKVSLGLKSISVDNIAGSIVLELSAKILRDQYAELIGINTIERCISEIEKNSPLKLRPAEFMESAEVLRCDVTKNLKMAAPPKAYITALHHLRVNNRYKVDAWHQRGNNGIVFHSKATSFKERIIFYDKLLDTQKDKELQKEMRLPQLQAAFTNVLRCETNIVQAKKIRELCGGSNKLSSILTSDANANLFLFNKIKSKCINLELFTQFDGLKFSTLEKRLGQQQIIRMLSYDMELIGQFIEARVSGNISRYKRQYRSLCIELLSAQEKVQESELYSEIEQQLRVA